MPPMAQMGGLAGVPQVIHRPVMPPAPVVVQQMAPVPSHMMDEPPSKKAKTEESLIPEHQWLHAHPVSGDDSLILINVLIVMVCDGFIAQALLIINKDV